ncbi:hypothetical protein D3C71_1586690 [compost metagenome]
MINNRRQHRDRLPYRLKRPRRRIGQPVVAVTTIRPDVVGHVRRCGLHRTRWQLPGGQLRSGVKGRHTARRAFLGQRHRGSRLILKGLYHRIQRIHIAIQIGNIHNIGALRFFESQIARCLHCSHSLFIDSKIIPRFGMGRGPSHCLQCIPPGIGVLIAAVKMRRLDLLNELH